MSRKNAPKDNPQEPMQEPVPSDAPVQDQPQPEVLPPGARRSRRGNIIESR